LTTKQFIELISSSNEFSFQDGIWYSSNSATLSYPEDGNDDYFELEESSYWFRHRNNCLVSIIKDYSPKSLFFDVGGGNGFVTKAIENAQIPSVLVEPGKGGVLNAKKRGIQNIICGTIYDLKVFTGKIHSIGAFDVIEHIPEDKKFIEMVQGMLKTGGLFFITVPAFQWLWSNEDTLAGHFRRYTKKNISNLLKDNGFDIVYSSYFFSALILPLFIIRTIPSTLRIRTKSNNQTKREHTANNGIIGKVLDSIWKWELRQVRKKKSIPFGTSCLIVARKK
jgi:Methyltransferase domain